MQPWATYVHVGYGQCMSDYYDYKAVYLLRPGYMFMTPENLY